MYGRASIADQGVITVTRKSEGKKTGPADSVALGKYQIDIAEDARVDGTLIAVGGGKGVRTGQSTRVRGILYSDGTVCHQGQLEGVLFAASLVDCRSETAAGRPGAGVPAAAGLESVLVGSIERLPSIRDYRVPFFMGEPRIVSWSEK